MTHYNQENYATFIGNARTRLIGIVIPDDITPAQGKSLLARLDELYGDIRIMYGETIKQSKEIERLIYRIETKGRTGSNETQRKINGVVAVENVIRGNDTVNLYNTETQIMKIKEDLEALLDVIKQKNSLIITMSGLLKIESSIGAR